MSNLGAVQVFTKHTSFVLCHQKEGQFFESGKLFMHGQVY